MAGPAFATGMSRHSGACALGAVMVALAALVLSPQISGEARAQTASDAAAASEKEIEKYREMINDPFANPGYLAVDRGEILWKMPRGANNVSLEACDLGAGPGKLEGAYAKLPRLFPDAGRVQDLEQRVLWCMETIQHLDTSDVIARRFGEPGTTSDMEDLSAFIANKSNGMPIEPQVAAPEEQAVRAVGEALFYRRAGPLDFSCATCHGEDGRRIRLQALPNFSKPGPDAQASLGSWPAYRVSQSQTRTMQHRLWDCYRQMRMPPPAYGSDGITALTLYLTKQAEGGVINAPAIKR